MVPGAGCWLDFGVSQNITAIEAEYESRGLIWIQPLADQSIFVRGAINGVIREAVIAAALTGLMILLFLASWPSTLIIAISIPLSILSSVIVLGLIHETINIMTLGGLALAVGILVDDATVTIENIEGHFENGADHYEGIFQGAA